MSRDETGRTARENVAQLVELTSARGFAASMVMLYHIDSYCGGILDRVLPMTSLGRLPVDFFFVLSGFVLAHVYGGAWSEGRYSHRAFLVRRFARIWPLHMVCLLAVAAIVWAGSRVGFSPPWTPTWGSFLAHATMLHATGISPDKAWNQPSWSVGAEWTAYLAFPAYLFVSSRLGRPLQKLAVASALFLILLGGARLVGGRDLLSLMNDGGAVRIIPSFFTGVVLREILQSGVGASRSTKELKAMLLAVVGVAGAALMANFPSAVVWPALPAIIYLLALLSIRPESNVLRARPLVWLGDASYALYLVHAPVLMVVYGLGAKLFGMTAPSQLLALGVVAAGCSICAAGIAHYVVERPAQRFVIRLGDRAFFTRRPAQAA